MKNLKFRIWDKELKVFIPEDQFSEIFFNLDFTSYAIDYEGLIGLHASKSEDRFVFQPCTLLKDCDGNLIYEGDILKFPDSSHIYEYIVKYSSGSGAFLAGGYFFNMINPNNLKITGNIFETK